jgi:hypothetical protein
MQNALPRALRRRVCEFCTDLNMVAVDIGIDSEVMTEFSKTQLPICRSAAVGQIILQLYPK